MPSVARVCVEVDLTKKIPKRVWIGCGEKGLCHEVLLENKPKYCKYYCNKGHDEESCILLLPNNVEKEVKKGYLIPKKILKRPEKNGTDDQKDEMQLVGESSNHVEGEEINDSFEKKTDQVDFDIEASQEEDKEEGKIEERDEDKNNCNASVKGRKEWKIKCKKIQEHIDKINNQDLQREEVQVIENQALSPKGTNIPELNKNLASKLLYL